MTGSGGAAGHGRPDRHGWQERGGRAWRHAGSGGTPGIGGSGTDGGVTVDCSATLPTGGTTYTGTNINGSADGLGYGIWTNGSGGSITVFPNAHAFSTSWNNSQDFLAHLGLDFNAPKVYTSYGTIHGTVLRGEIGNRRRLLINWNVRMDAQPVCRVVHQRRLVQRSPSELQAHAGRNLTVSRLT